MKKKLIILSVIITVVVVAVIVFFVVNNRQNNPLGLSSDFVFDENADTSNPEMFGYASKIIMPYTYKKYIQVYFQCNENNSVKAIAITSTKNTNLNYEKDCTNLIKYLLNKNFFTFTKEEKSQIISHIHYNNDFSVNNINFFIGTIDDLFIISIVPR